MNNIFLYNMIRAMDKKIQRQKEETVDIMKNGYLCIGKRCVIRSKCSNKGKQCKWDLRSEFWKDGNTNSILGGTWKLGN